MGDDSDIRAVNSSSTDGSVERVSRIERAHEKRRGKERAPDSQLMIEREIVLGERARL